MHVRALGPGGPSVTVLGCGEVSLPRAAARGLDSSEVTRALHAAIELGVTLVDVAWDDDSVRLVGDAVRALRARDRAVIATRIPPRTRGTWADALPQALPVHHVIERVDAALRASKLEAIGLAQLPLAAEFRDAKVAWPELLGACAQLVRDGKVLRWGAIIAEDEEADAATVARLADGDWLASAQLTFHVCARTAGPLIDALAARGLAILARRVLAGGALAGTLGPGARLTQRDDRRAIDDAGLTRIAVGAAELAACVAQVPPAARSCPPAQARLETLAARRPEHVEAPTLPDLALRYAIHRPGVTAALVRLHRHAHVMPAIAAASAPPLSAALTKRLDALAI